MPLRAWRQAQAGDSRAQSSLAGLTQTQEPFPSNKDWTWSSPRSPAPSAALQAGTRIPGARSVWSDARELDVIARSPSTGQSGATASSTRTRMASRSSNVQVRWWLPSAPALTQRLSTAYSRACRWAVRQESIRTIPAPVPGSENVCEWAATHRLGKPPAIDSGINDAIPMSRGGIAEVSPSRSLFEQRFHRGWYKRGSLV